MGNKPYATTTRDGRFYNWRGERYWSVTTITKPAGNKESLINWAKRFTAEYAVDNFEQLRNMLRPQGGELREPDLDMLAANLTAAQRVVEGAREAPPLDREQLGNVLRPVSAALQLRGGVPDREGAVDWLKDASFRDRDRKGKVGDLMHDAIEAYTLGQPFPPWAPEIRTRMLAFERWLARYEPDYDVGMAEAQVFSRSEEYAGTLDCIFAVGRGPHKGRRVLNDYKSSQRGIFPEAALQLVLYRRAEFVAGPDMSERPMPEVDTCAALWLPDGGEAQLVEVATGDDVYRAALYAREIYRWQIETSKNVLLGEMASEPPEAAPPEQRELADALSSANAPAEGATAKGSEGGAGDGALTSAAQLSPEAQA